MIFPIDFTTFVFLEGEVPGVSTRYTPAFLPVQSSGAMYRRSLLGLGNVCLFEPTSKNHAMPLFVSSIRHP